jgi:hypothetical protein
VEILKEYRTMLFGCRAIHMYTDHRNLTFSTFQAQRVLLWRLFLEDYGSIGNTLRVLTAMKPPQGAVQAEQLFDTAIADLVYATRCTYHSALKSTPGGVAFGRDMILNSPLITDLQQLQKRRQELIDKRLKPVSSAFAYDYAVGEKDWFITPISWTLAPLVRIPLLKCTPMAL